MGRKKISKETTEVSTVSGSEARVRRKRRSKKIPLYKKDPLPGLNPKLFAKIKQQYFDIDYIDKLNDEEKAWLSKFMWEYLGANLSGKDLLHTTDEQKKDCYSRNNSRQRDLYNYLLIAKRNLDINDVTVIKELDLSKIESNRCDLEESKAVVRYDIKNHPDEELTLEDYIFEAKLK